MCQLNRASILLILSVFLTAAIAQTGGIDLLLGKARSLEGRGRMDLAAENWRRVLLADPNNTEALAGLARFAKQNENAEEASGYLTRLRKANPKDPAIAEIGGMRSLTPQQSARLDEAGRFAMQGNADEAMKIYREIFGQEPPPGKWVEAFYKTEAASTGGKEDAILHLRNFCARYPQNEVYQLWLAEVLTWGQPTRMEGFQMLQAIKDPGTVEQARTAWRQALLWEKNNPGVQASLTEYLERYPDPELQAILIHLRRNHPSDPNVELAYQALRSGDLVSAELLFAQVIHRAPNDVAAITGLGYVREKQQRFSEALGLFQRALSLAPQRRDIRDASETAKFWSEIQQAGTALTQNRTELALSLYRSALELRPQEREALLGYGRALTHHAEFSAAGQIYGALPESDPQVVNDWFQLLKAEVQSKASEVALATAQKMSPALRQRLESLPQYQSEMALACYSVNRPADECSQTLEVAMKLSERDDNEDALNARLQLAGTLMDKGFRDQALRIYQRAVVAYPEKVEPWEGLLGTYSRLHDPRATAVLRSIPPTTYANFLNQSGFLNVVASIYADHGACQPAESLLKHSLVLDQYAGREPATATKLQLAGLWLRAGNYEQARQAYRELLDGDQNNPDAWRGYISALHSLRTNKTALTESKRIPGQVRVKLEEEPDYFSLLAGIQSELGNKEEALRLLILARESYQLRKQMPPVGLEVQLAWALVDSSSRQQELRSLLDHLSGRSDLTTDERNAVDSLWSASVVRRAQAAYQSNDAQQSIAILRDASNKAPGDPRIQAELGLAYLKVREYSKAVDAYATWGMDGADASDYRAAAGAAMAVHNRELANRFLQQGLQHWPDDSKLLHMAGELAAGQGDYDSAERYLKSSLAAAHAVPAKPRGGPQGAPKNSEIGKVDGSEALRAANAPPAMAFNTLPQVAIPSVSAQRFSPSPAKSVFSLPDDSIAGTVAGCRDIPQTEPALLLIERGTKKQEKTENIIDDVEQENIQNEIDVIHNRNTPVMIAESNFTFRTGNPGFERLITEDASLANTQAILNRVRVEADVHAVSLHNGKAEAGSYLQLGTLPRGTIFADRPAFGIAASAQISTNSFGMFLGSTPDGFPIRTLLGGVRYNPREGPFTIMFLRDSVRETMLSYAGVRDPASGTIWGGVTSTAVTSTIKRGGELRGEYASAGFARISGEHVADNFRVDGNAGAYWQALKGDNGTLAIGADLSALHFDKNLRYFTLGQGGYFSPQSYLLLAAPITWTSHHKHMDYRATVSVGIQHFSEDNSPFFPNARADPGTSLHSYGAQTRTGPNYNVDFRMNRQLSSHWFAGIFVSANNARDYATQSVGLTLRYLLRRTPVDMVLRPSSIPDWKGKPLLSIQ